MKVLFNLMAKLIFGIEKNKDTVKALINARAFIRIITYHRERGGLFIRRLLSSQSINEQPKHAVCFITSVPCLTLVPGQKL